MWYLQPKARSGYVFSSKANMKRHCMTMHKSVKDACKPIANARAAAKTVQAYTHTNLEKVGCSSDAKATAAVHSESDSARADVSLDSESGCCEENETQ